MTSDIIMHSFSVTSVYIDKTRFFRLQFCRRQYRSIFKHFDVIGQKATEFGKITQNKGHFAVLGYSRSPILVPMESPYATSYWWLMLTYILSRSVCRLYVKFSLSTGGYLALTHRSGWTHKLRTTKFTSYEPRKIVLSYGISISTDDYFILSQSTRLTDGQTESRQQELALITWVRCALKMSPGHIC